MSTQGSYQNANLFKKSHVQYTHTQSQSIQQAAVALAEISMTFTTQKYMKRFILRVREHGWLQRGLPLTAKDTMSQPKSGNFEMPLDIWKFGSSLVSRQRCLYSPRIQKADFVSVWCVFMADIFFTCQKSWECDFTMCKEILFLYLNNFSSPKSEVISFLSQRITV